MEQENTPVKKTCKEAVQLLKQGLAMKVWWRPNMHAIGHNPDDDPALVWLVRES